MSTQSERPRRTFTAAQRLRRNESDRAKYANHRTEINDKRRVRYESNKEDIIKRNARRRTHRQAAQHDRRHTILAKKRRHFDAAVFCEADHDISNLQDVISQRRQQLEAARASLGISISTADPCVHCGATLFGKESRGICCKNGKAVLPPLPPLPGALEELYTSTETSAVKFRREARAYNCKSNFASLNVEDGELQRFWGNHILSIMGR